MIKPKLVTVNVTAPEPLLKEFDSLLTRLGTRKDRSEQICALMLSFIEEHIVVLSRKQLEDLRHGLPVQLGNREIRLKEEAP